MVTAIRREQPISQSPSNLYVITQEDIRLSGATDIPTLLRRVPGMEVMQMTAGEFNVSARGDNQQRRTNSWYWWMVDRFTSTDKA